MIEVRSTEQGKIEVSKGGLLGQVITSTKPNGDTRTTPLIESREEYDVEMMRHMVWLGLIEPPKDRFRMTFNIRSVKRGEMLAVDEPTTAPTTFEPNLVELELIISLATVTPVSQLALEIHKEIQRQMAEAGYVVVQRGDAEMFSEEIEHYHDEVIAAMKRLAASLGR